MPSDTLLILADATLAAGCLIGPCDFDGLLLAWVFPAGAIVSQEATA